MAKKNVIDTMKAAELSLAERTAGLSIATLEDPNFPKTDLLIAMAWVIAKRQDPTITFKAFGEAHTLKEVTEFLGLHDDDEEDE